MIRLIGLVGLVGLVGLKGRALLLHQLIPLTAMCVVSDCLDGSVLSILFFSLYSE